MQKFLILLIFFSAHGLYAETTQWASKVISFSEEINQIEYSSNQILGKPSVMPSFGKTPCSWTVNKSNKSQWIIVEFENYQYISQIAIAENYFPGAISNVLLYDSLDQGHSVYLNKSPKPLKQEGRMFRIFPENIDFRSKKMKIIVNLFNYFEQYQIDAVAISDSKAPIAHTINKIDNSELASKPENLGENVNSFYSELAPVVTQDGNRIYYTRDGHPNNTGEDNRQDIWYSDRDENGQFGKAINMGAPLNNDGPNFIISVTPDGNTIIVGNIYGEEGGSRRGISESNWLGSKWAFPKGVKINEYYNTNPRANYCLSPSREVLITAIDNAASYGNIDLYVSFKNSDGSWSKPENIGSDINTAGNEISPFIAADEKTIYFSTDGRPGYGSNDMFISRRLDSTWKKWSEPVNMGPVINSNQWDAYYTVPASGDYAYYVSTINSIGKEDIFRIKLTEEMKPDVVTLISGEVYNSKTNEPIGVEIEYETLPEGKKVGSALSDPKTGEYKIVLPAGKKYGFLAKADGFVSINENIDLTNVSQYSEISRDLFLVPIEKGQTIRINNIFFNFGEAELLEDSYSELRRIAELLKKNPDMKIRINGHTDNVGSHRNNYLLSLNRAKNVAEFLYSLGIDKTRIKVKGYGERKPIANNSTEEGRQKNRRVEFVIL